MNLFQEELEKTAIDRIHRFAKIAETMGFDICLGFSGGKDSQVVYDLCKRSGVPFKAYFNRSFESPVTKNFIRQNYPDVIWRHDHRYGFIENIRKVHGGLFPSVTTAFCCEDYKHNPKYVDKCSITGVRKAESSKRKSRTAISVKNKTELKKHKALIDEYFIENCQSIGTASIIQLLPIVDWSDDDVWDYIYNHDLPVNPEYQHSDRVGCIVCPKANFTRNFYTLMKYPKLVDAFILAKEKGSRERCNWIITYEGKDYKDDKPYFICRWLNHSWMPFTRKQQELYETFRKKYDLIHSKKDENKQDNPQVHVPER